MPALSSREVLVVAVALLLNFAMSSPPLESKISYTFRLGIQSYTIRTLAKWADMVDGLSTLNLTGVELWPGHWDITTNQSEIEERLKDTKNIGYLLDGYGVATFTNDRTQANSYYEFAKKLGITDITADPDPDAVPMLLELGASYGINLAVHNHGRNHRYGHIGQMKALLDASDKSIGLCLDTGWALDSGEDPILWANTFRDRLYRVHLKDFNYVNGIRVDVITGTGLLNLPGMLQALKTNDFQHNLSIEYEGDVGPELSNVKACVKNVISAIGSLGN